MSATGNPRNKVALKPGHSLMDWIRLGNSGKDLAGTGGAYLCVTKAELAKHNKRDDAWLSIRGKVYNVTSYMDFHPGGAEQLMKGVGIDATKIFNEVHAWVNYESILQKCMVGQLRTTCDEDIDITSSLGPPETTSKHKISSIPPNGTTAPKKPFQMDWFQQVGSICLVFYTKNPGPDVHIKLEEEDRLSLRINGKSQTLKLQAAVTWPPSVTVDVAGKVQVRLTKRQPGLWSKHGSLEDSSAPVPEYWSMIVASNTALTHDTRQLDLSYSQNVFNYVPTGHHVLVKATIGEEEVVRPYTPVSSLAGLNVPPVCCVRLIVKRYNAGRLSPWLADLAPGATLSLSLPLGSFSTRLLASATQLLLLAAGTGLTPLISLITSALRSPRYTVQLVFFNKTEKDIIWQEQLDKLMADNPRFSVEHVLSEPCSQWSGRKGHVNSSLLLPLLPISSPDLPKTHFVCICGPSSFTQLTQRCLTEDLGFTSNNYYCFLGQ